MTRDELLRLIAQGEGQKIDFKEETIKPGRLAEILVAFANDEGGTILIGVDDEGHIQGVSDLKRATDNAIEAISHCSPPLGIGLPQAVEMAPGVTVLAVEIPAQLPRVYHTHGRYLRRTGSMNMALDEAALRRLLYERGELSFEAEPVAEATLADLDAAKVNSFRQRYEDVYGRSLTLPNRDLLIAMGCLARDDYSTVAGLLLFGREPQRHFFEPHISIARYRGENVGAEYRLDSRDYYGTIIEAAIAASDYVNEHVQVFSRLLPGKAVRQDVPQYPRFAIREIIINAIVHRDWSIKGSRVLIKMFSDRIEVQSPGPLPPPVTPQNIREEHQLRNPRIAQAFKDYGLIEKFGNGIDRIFEEIETHPFKPRLPTFHDTGASVIVTLYGAMLPSEETEAAREIGAATFGLSERQGRALEYLQTYEQITRSEYCRMFGVEDTEAYRELRELLTKGLIARHGRGRSTYYVLAP
jgi:ATP-dependent DNA helicase RecG